MNETQIWIVVGVAFYMAAMLLIGWWAGRRVHDTRDYIVAGGRLGWLLSIGTLFATWFGAETCMGSSSAAFHKGFLGVIADPFGAGLCLILSGLFFARYFRERDFQTIIDFFTFRYGARPAAFFSLFYVPAYLGWIGAQLLAFGIILNSLTGLPLLPSIVVSTAVVLVYTYSGGMWADTLTDFFQMIVLVAGLLILFPLFLRDWGGFAALKEQVPAEFFYLYPRSRSSLDWLNYAQAWIIVGLGSLPAQDLFQRSMAPKSPAVARWSSVIGGVLYIGIGLLPVLLGIFGRVAMPGSEGESVLIAVSREYLPPPLVALMVGALLSAIMSSADSALLAPASIIGRNVVPHFKPSAGERERLAWCKGSVIVLGFLSLVLAVYFKNIYRLCQESWGILLVGLAAPMAAGVYWKKATPRGAVSAALAGTAAWLAFKIFLPEGYPHNLLGFLVSVAALVAVSLAGPSPASQNTP